MNTLAFILGCAVCSGASDAKVGPALNGVIFLMFGCVGSVLTLITFAGWSIVRRARNHPPDQSQP